MSRSKINLIITLICTLLMQLLDPALSYAEEIPSSNLVSVKLVNNIGSMTSLSIDLTGDFQLKENSQSYSTSSLKVQTDQNALVLSKGSEILYRGSSITFLPDTYGVNSIIKVNSQPYLGQMQFVLENGLFIRPINTLPMEDYLKGVVPLEMPASWELEALKAQAIAARTYAVRRSNQVIDDSINFQVYGGYKWSEKSTRAVEETKGQVIQQNGQLIDALYSSSNGGMTEASESLWQPTSYLLSQTDPYDPQNKWSLSFQKTQIALEGKDLHHPETWWDQTREADPSISPSIKSWLQQNGYENHDLKLVRITNLIFHSDRTPGNRIKKGMMGLDFLAKHPNHGFLRNTDGSLQVIHKDFVDVPAPSLRKLLGGGNRFKSYFIDSLSDDNNSYAIHGRGFGHGVGMSQYGANEMSKQSKTAKDILAFYFSGTAITTVGKVEQLESELETATPTTPAIPVNPPVSAAEPVHNLKLSSPTFSLGSKEPITIQYTLQKPATISVRAYDEKGNIRRVIINNSSQSAENKIVSWDGYGLGVGIYTIVVEATDESGVKSNVTSKIEFVTASSFRSTGLAKKGIIKSTVLVGVRPQPSFQAKPSKLLKNGDKVDIVGKNDRWLKVKFGSVIGFVPDNFIQTTK